MPIIQVNLPRAQKRRIEKTLAKTKDKLTAVRCQILLLLNQTYSAKTVAEMVCCVRATVYRTVYRFEELGEDSLND